MRAAQAGDRGEGRRRGKRQADATRVLMELDPLELPGIHRAWQLQHAPHRAQIGPDPVGNYMHLYEADAPENLFDPSLGEDRLPLKSGQEFAGRHFARLLLKAEPQR